MLCVRTCKPFGSFEISTDIHSPIYQLRVMFALRD
jgi:hypothetical protein